MTEPLRILHSVAWLDADKGGPAYTVPSLTSALKQSGHHSTVCSLGTKIDHPHDWGCDIRRPNDLQNFGFLFRLGLSRSLRSEMLRHGPDIDVFHSHGLWMLPNVYPAQAAKRHNKPFIISPHGMIDPVCLQMSSGKKKIFLALGQKAALKSAACFHATAPSEAEHIRTFGLDQPVALIPNGVDLPDDTSPPTPDTPRAKTILSLGRLHPIKGLDRLITAWAELEADFPDWSLRIVGPDERNYAAELKALIARFGVHRTTIEPPVYDSDKTALYQKSDLFVLATKSENFALTVAESLAARTPVICTKGAPWQGLENHRCGWWIDHGRDPLVAALTEAMSLPEEARRDMGARGREWVARDFSWSAIGKAMGEVYVWLARGGESPDCVAQ